MECNNVSSQADDLREKRRRCDRYTFAKVTRKKEFEIRGNKRLGTTRDKQIVSRQVKQKQILKSTKLHQHHPARGRARAAVFHAPLVASGARNGGQGPPKAASVTNQMPVGLQTQ